MIRGFEILTDQMKFGAAHELLPEILSIGSNENYYWYVKTAWIDMIALTRAEVFTKEWMTNEEVIQESAGDHYAAVELALIRYSSQNDAASFPQTYEEFVHSTSSMVVVIRDWYYMRLYIKNAAEFEKTKAILEKKQIQYEIVTDENDGSNRF